MAAGHRRWTNIARARKALRNPICHLERYGLCLLPGIPINYDAHHLEPDAHSCDHIIPSHLGGPDTWENSADSHRRCNCARHDDPLVTLALSTTREW